MPISNLIKITGALCLLGCVSSPPEGTPSENLIEMVQNAQRLLWQKHGVAEYFSVWSDDGKKVEGRSENPDKVDTTLTRAQYEAVCRLRFTGAAPDNVTLKFHNVHTEAHGGVATLRHRVTIEPAETCSGLLRSMTSDERISMRRDGQKWRIIEWRSWPIALRGEDYVETFDAGQWAALDDRASKVQTRGELVGALMAGRRYAEAYAVAKTWTAHAGRDYLKPDVPVWSEGGAKRSDAWVSRGYLALLVSDAADAALSFRQALELDPKAIMPPYARTAGTKK